MATTTPTKKRATAAKTTAAKRKTSSRAKATPKAATPTPLTRVERVREAAERAVVVPVGAALEARDAVAGTVEDLQARYGTAEAAEKQLKRFERRGEKVRKQAERRVKKARTRVERELKARRRTAEKRVRTERTRVEREAKQAAARMESVREAITQIDLANSTGFLQSQVEQALQTGVNAGTEAVRRASERLSA